MTTATKLRGEGKPLRYVNCPEGCASWKWDVVDICPICHSDQNGIPRGLVEDVARAALGVSKVGTEASRAALDEALEAAGMR